MIFICVMSVSQLSRRKRKALNLVEQQTQLMREYRTLTGSGDAKPAGDAKDRGSKKQGSLDKLINYLSKQFKNMTRLVRGFGRFMRLQKT